MRLFIVCVALLAVQIAAHPRTRRQAELKDADNLTPLDEESVDDPNDRDKRMLEGVTQAKYGVKNALLGFVFGKQSGTASRSLTKSRPTRRSGGTKSTTTEDIPVFDRNKVSLQFPGELFGPSVSLLIRSTKVIGSVIQNSAERYRTFLGLFRPLFRGVFAIKGLDPPTTTTTPKPPKARKAKDAKTNKNDPKSSKNEIRR